MSRSRFLLYRLDPPTTNYGCDCPRLVVFCLYHVRRAQMKYISSSVTHKLNWDYTYTIRCARGRKHNRIFQQCQHNLKHAHGTCKYVFGVNTGNISGIYSLEIITQALWLRSHLCDLLGIIYIIHKHVYVYIDALYKYIHGFKSITKPIDESHPSAVAHQLYGWETPTTNTQTTALQP